MDETLFWIGCAVFALAYQWKRLSVVYYVVRVIRWWWR